MPTPESMVQFKAGLQAAFDEIQSKDLNTVYFVTDTQRLFVGETEYSRPISYGSALPTGYLPPNSLFVVEGSGTRDLFFSKDGASWEPIAHINEAVLNAEDKTIGIINAKAYGSATKVPVITVDSKGAITAISEQDISFPQVTVPDVKIASATGSGNVIASLKAEGHTITPTLFNAVEANSSITASSAPSIVQYDAKGLVTSGTAAGSAATKDVATQAIGTQATDDLVTGNQVKTYVDTAVADLSGAMHFAGMFEDLPEANSYDPGDVCVVGNKEYILVNDEGTKEWRDLGDESIYAVKGSIVNSDISATAAIDQSKIAGTLGDNANLAADISDLNSGKVDKVASATANHITVFGAGGTIADGGVAVSDLATAASVTALTSRVGTAEGDIDDLQAVTIAGKALSGDITIALEDLSDVDLTTSAPTNGQSLVFNGTDWVPGAPDAGSVSWTNVTGRPTGITFNGDVTGSVTLGNGALTSNLAIAAGSIVNADISDSAAIAISKISGLQTALNGKVNNTITVNGQPLTGNVNITTITGNAGSADKVNHSLTINGQEFDGSADVEVTTANTTYTFSNGSNGSFTVTPSNGSAQTVSIGKPATAGTADAVAWTGITGRPSIAVTGGVTGTLDLNAETPTLVTTLRALTNNDIPTGITASKISGALTNATIAGGSVTGTVANATSATNATNATNDADGNEITETYATKAELTASTLTWGSF